MNIKNIPLKDLKGAEIKIGEDKFMSGDVIANILIADKTGGKMKLYNLAQKFSSEKSVEVDAADLSMIKKAVETAEGYNALVTGQLLVMLDLIK